MSIMDIEPLNNDTKVRIDISDATYQYSTMSQLSKIDRTRKILLLLISMEFVLSTISVITVIYSYALDFTLGFESYNVVFRFLSFLSFLCFGFGLIAADRYYVTGLRLFAMLLMLDLILSYLSLINFIIIPMTFEKYSMGKVPVIIFILIFLMIFFVILFLQAYIIRLAYKLSNLLNANKY
ncbi:unnamed protein product [Rotaria socialis]|uniref:Uncharacterized protein n=2 Tax=Rotaria socialis TaxID=392032 RepID=A0A817SMZ2_9BILA|nr:unnamed protein product [Rotaria socialis]CAF3680138.1 unnamed protein product [Rotaria socialis]CAF3763778.1 unnamed protein product [Rotaria socialis]CAF4124283.1 unnamed protein product [Rotaria socialis]CAF4204699.1 unnamed protein product [Rotaria socialis]